MEQPKNCNNEVVYCVVCKMMFPLRRIEKHKTSGMHLKEMDDYKRLHDSARKALISEIKGFDILHQGG